MKRLFGVVCAAAAVLVAGAVPGLGAASAGAAGAATPLHAQFAAVSCSSASACTGVGWYNTTAGPSLALAERWNGSSWSIEATPNRADAVGMALHGVSCPSASSCIAVGSYLERAAPSISVALVEQWNGTSWKITVVPSPSAGTGGSAFTAVSCGSPSFCTAVGFYVDNSINRIRSFAATWNGSKWRIDLPPIVTGGSELEAVSCVSTSWCMADGSQDSFGQGGRFLAEVWSGGHWSVTLKLSKKVTGGTLTGISCTSTTYCLAIGEEGGGNPAAEQWTGTAWTQQTVGTPETAASATALTCTSATVCLAVGGQTPFQTGDPAWAASFNGSSWTPMSAAAPGNTMIDTLTGVSCTSASSCEAVGFQNADLRAPVDEALAEFWNGTSWSIQSTPDPTVGLATAASAVTPSSVWTQQAQLTNGVHSSGGPYGSAVALSGNTLIVGNPASPARDGSAYVYTLSGSTWSLQATLTDSGGQALFGSCVSLAGNVAVIGADGRSYVFDRSGSTWTKQAELQAPCAQIAPSGNEIVSWDYVYSKNAKNKWVAQLLPAPAGSTQFGMMGDAISGNTVMVGALDSTGTGTVYVFQRTGKTWTQEAALHPAVPVAGDAFGARIALSTNDETAVIGAPLVGQAPSDTGSAYIFTRSGSMWTQQAALTRTLAKSAQYEFGGAVAISGNDVVVGAFNSGHGAVYLYPHTASGWNVSVKMPRAATTKFSYYGSGVSLAIGTTMAGMAVAAGAQDWDGTGAVNIFTN